MSAFSSVINRFNSIFSIDNTKAILSWPINEKALNIKYPGFFLII
ncbi:MAG: hypothetical protein K940chlam5_00187 [Candidatus Anoxychlamydiales bacterium]|nr:hypothetical protein [Candidatus Anoxychlamydiales bacterium]